MKQMAVFTLALAAALTFASARPVPAATSTPGNPVALATGANSSDTAIDLFLDGSFSNPDQIAQQVLNSLGSAFSGEAWLLTDKDEITLGQIQNNQFQPLLPALAVAADDQNAYYVVHGHNQGLILNGAIWRDKPGATTGFAVLDIVEFDSQGTRPPRTSSTPSPGRV